MTTCGELLSLMFGDADPEHQITIVTKLGDNPLTWTRHAAPEMAAKAALTAPAGADVYFGVGLIRGSPARRGKAQDISCIASLWADVDCQSPDHPNAPTRQAALELIADMPIAPSVIVDSGWGFHVYWLFHEPWVFDDDTERARAQAISHGWHELLRAKAAQRHYHIDAVWDLARILRVPGTINYKYGQNVDVTMYEISDPMRRYDPSDFEEYAYKPIEQKPRSLVDVHGDAMVDEEKLKYLLDNSQKFSGAWYTKREDLKSASERDMSIATIALIAGWTEQQAANLIIKRRMLDGDAKKASRVGYIRGTIAKAATVAREYQAIEEVVDNMLPEPPPIEEQAVVINEYEDVDPTEQADPGDFPTELFSVPGFVERYMDWVTSRAASPCPVATFGGALAMLSWLTGRKICTPGDSRSNFYIIAIGRSGVGKNAPREANSLIISELGAMAAYADEIQTAEGMEDLLISRPCILWQPDEFDVIMRNMSREDGQGNGRWEALSKRLRTIYTSSHMTLRGRVRAKARKDDPDDVNLIHQPHLVMYASATPRAFLESISSAQVLDGLLSRCTILPIPYILIEQDPKAMGPVPYYIMEQAKAWHEWSPDGNLQDVYPHPLKIGPSKVASDMFREYRRECISRQQDPDCPDVEVAILSRAAQTAQKASLLYAASEVCPNSQAPVIDQPAATWGINFTRAVNAHMLYQIHSHLGDSPFAKAQLKVIRFMREHDGSATRRDIIRLLRAEKDWGRVIDTLKKQERIEECQIAGKRRMSDGYRLK